MLVLSASARAQPSPFEPDPVERGPHEGDELSTPTSADWLSRYEAARAKLLAGEFADAAVRFAELETTAANRVDRAMARAQRTLADEWTSKNLTFTPRRSELGESAPPPRPKADRRSTDELVALALTASTYGVSTGALLSAALEPDRAFPAVFPALALAGAAVAGVVGWDEGRPFRYGVPQSITTGIWMGLEQGIAWTVWENARDRFGRDLEGGVVAGILWGAATAGGVLGGVLGSTLVTTPGRSAWVGSVSLFSGALLGFTTGAVARNDDTAPWAATGVGLTLGTGAGFLTAGLVSPPISRVRYLDLSGTLGGLTAGGVYLAASDGRNGQAASGITALGIAGGLVLGWLATSGIAEDPPRRVAEEDRSFLAKLKPTLMPSTYLGQTTGATLGFASQLD